MSKDTAVATVSKSQTVGLLDVPVGPVSRGELIPVNSALNPTSGIGVTRPAWMTDEQAKLLEAKAAEWLDLIKSNPADITLQTRVSGLGIDGSREMAPHVQLYEKKVSAAMQRSKEGSPVNATLLSIKQALDSINPGHLAKQPVTYRVAFFLKRTRLPQAQEVMDAIYARRETVQSTIQGLREGLWAMRDDLTQNAADLVTIYEGMLSGQRLIERDIYFGQLLHGLVSEYLPTVQDKLAQQNVERVLANLTTAVNDLQTEETANLMFFEGVQNMAGLTNDQVNNITRYTDLLQRSVLASLALRVAASELAASTKVTQGLRGAIGDTIADSMKEMETSGKKITEARHQSLIDLDKLQEGCDALERLYEQQAQANREVIEKGAETSRRLRDVSAKLRSRIDVSEGVVDKMREQVQVGTTEN